MKKLTMLLLLLVFVLGMSVNVLALESEQFDITATEDPSGPDPNITTSTELRIEDPKYDVETDSKDDQNLTDASKTDGSTTTTTVTTSNISPKTGENTLPITVALAAFAASGVAGYSVKKVRE